MPDDEKKKWTSRDFYQAPDAFEDEANRKTVIYSAPRQHGKLYYALIIIVATALVAAVVLALTGVMKLPSLPADLFGKLQEKKSGGENATDVTTTPVTGMPMISEFMTNNDSALMSADGKYYDWIELYNPTDHAINLSGFVLSNGLKNPDTFALPDYNLEGGKFVVVFASGKNSTETEIHAPFKLKAPGLLLLADSNGRVIQQISYPSVSKDHSYAIDMHDFGKWVVTDKYTPGNPN